MATCDVCGKHIDMPYNCRGCGGSYCGEHRLPENHDCPGLDQWNDPSGVFDSGFDDSVEAEESGGLRSRVSSATGRGGPLAYFRGNVAYSFLAIILIVFLFQYVVYPLLGISPPSATNPSGDPLWRASFLLTSAHPLYVWTWVTSVFSHGSFAHIFGNGIVLFFFGPVLEQRIGSKRFAALFLVTGMIAGLAQIGFGYALAALGMGALVSGVLGASGGIMGILAVLTVLNPDLKVYLYFILPIPIWVLTGGYAVLSLVGAVSNFSVVGGNVAHFAHLSGLLLGLAYGYYVQDKVGAPRDVRFGANRGGPGGPGGPGGRF